MLVQATRDGQSSRLRCRPKKRLILHPAASYGRPGTRNQCGAKSLVKSLRGRQNVCCWLFPQACPRNNLAIRLAIVFDGHQLPCSAPRYEQS